MSNEFIKTSEIEIIPIFEGVGAKLIKKAPNEIAFSFRNVEFSIYLEREFEVYAVVSSLKLKQSVYLSELLSDYLNMGGKGTCHLSERYPMDKCMRSLIDTIVSQIFPLILDGRIIEAINKVMSNREEGLRKYDEKIAEREAEKAFKEKRYEDVILHYAKILKLNDVQKKRLDISRNKIKGKAERT